MFFLLIKKRKKMINKVKNATKKGFSLVELLVVVAIIGVLAGVGIVAYNNYIDDAETKVIEANAKLLAKKLSAEAAKNRTKGAAIDTLISGSLGDIVAGGAKKEIFKLDTATPPNPIASSSCDLGAAAGIRVWPTPASGSTATGASVCYKVDAAATAVTIKAF
jgi:prepilin-type N-terminal cleavage/methylation domain-containing protein